jgi:hypothetical protein
VGDRIGPVLTNSTQPRAAPTDLFNASPLVLDQESLLLVSLRITQNHAHCPEPPTPKPRILLPKSQREATS